MLIKRTDIAINYTTCCVVVLMHHNNVVSVMRKCETNIKHYE